MEQPPKFKKAPSEPDRPSLSMPKLRHHTKVHSVNPSVKHMNRLELGKDEKYNHLMNFNEDVLKLEFEKAERMLKKTDRLIEKYKDKSSPPKKLTVKFALPDQ